MFESVLNTSLVVNTSAVFLPVKLIFELKLKILLSIILKSINSQPPKSFTDFSENRYIYLGLVIDIIHEW